MKRASPLLLACAALLSVTSGAQPTDPKADPPRGNCHDSCTVTVIVPAGCGSGIRVAPDPITVTRGNDTTITWNIVPASPTGWKFDPTKGIFIQGLDSYAKGRFAPGSVEPHKFVIRHENKGAAAFKYDINLVKGAERCSLDPVIVDW